MSDVRHNRLGGGSSCTKVKRYENESFTGVASEVKTYIASLQFLV